MDKPNLLTIIICALLVVVLIALGMTVSRVSKKRAEISILQETLKEKDARLSQMEQQIEEIGSEKSTWSRRKTNLSKELRLMKEDVISARKKESSLSKQVEMLSEEKKRLEDTLAETTRSMQERFQATTEKIKKEATLKNEQLLEQRKNLLMQLEDLKGKFENFDEEKSNLQNDLIDLAARLMKEKAKLDCYKLGFSFENEKNHEAAIKEYEEILQIDPRDAHANLRLASIYIHGIKDPDKASYYSRKYSTSKSSRRIEQDIDIDLTEAAKKEVDLTVKLNEAKQRLGDINKQTMKFHYNLALMYDKMGGYKEAIEEYEKALELTPDDSDIHYNLGIVYDDHIKDKEKAIFHYQRYLDLCPDTSDARKVEGWIARAKTALEWEKKLR